MRRPLFSIDRLSDRPVMFTVAVLSAGGAAVAWSMLHQTEPGKLLAEGLAAFSVILFVWGFFGRVVDRSRRVKLDRAVDDEMGKKWGPGFARTVGVYEKPWYLLCGETGVGKTAALRAGRLPMAIGPDGQPVTDATQGVNGTFMFDWWFFEDAVVLDSAGDLIANPDERWSAFLDRIHDARPARPINGMILSVSAEDLLGDVETVREKAGLLARQVEVARQRLHVRFPLYLLVTKSDLITGFSDYFPAGSDLKSSFQILGWSNPQDPRHDDRPTPAAAVRAGLDGVVADLRRRRSLAMARTTTARPDADLRIDHLDEMFAFPAAVAACLDNLEEFATKLVERSGTTAPPFLRGVYFTSALRTGDALDIELRNAFGVDQLPTSRRKPSDRAFFLRDLLLEKIVPEAGMVAPLQDVVSANLRRTRMVIGVSAAAAVAVIAVTALGFKKTVGRVQADRDFWQTIETREGSPAALVMFGPDGSYHGGDKLPSGKTVLATHRQAAELSGAVVASSLLPLSTELDRDRKEAHADLFREAVLVPALTPAPPAADVPADRVAVMAKLMTDTQTPDPIAVQSLRDDARAMVEAGTVPEPDKKDLLELIRHGVPARDDNGNAAATVRLSNTDRDRIAVATAAWVEKYTADRREAIRVKLTQSRITLQDVHKLEQVDQHFAAAFGPDGTADEQAASIAELKAAARPVDMTPVDPHLTDNAPELLALPTAVGTSNKVTEAGTRINHAAAGFNIFLTDNRNEWYDAATGFPPGSRPVDVKAKLAAEIDRINRDDLATVDGKPAIVARLDRDRAVLATGAALGDVKSRFDKVQSPYPHPYFKLPAVLTGIDADIANQVKAIGPGTDASADASKRILTTAGQSARDAAWNFAATSPGDVFVVTDPAGGPAKPLDLSVTPAASTDLFFRTKSDPKTGETIQTWLETNRTLAVVPHPAAVAGWLERTDSALKSVVAGYDSAWVAASLQQQWPDLSAWNQLPTRLADLDPVKVTAAVDQVIAPNRDAFGVVAGATQFPDLSEKGKRQLAELTTPAGAARMKGVTDFLRTGSFATATTADVRRTLLTDPASLDRRLAAAVDAEPASFHDRFWQYLLQRSVDLLIEDRKPAVVTAMGRIRDTAADTYPLVQSGRKSWNGDIKSLRSDVDAIGLNNAAGLKNAMAIRIRDLDVITADWDEYLGYLNRLCDDLEKPVNGSIKFEKTNSRGNWSYVAIAPAGKPAGRPFMYDKAMKPTPIDDVTEITTGISVSLLSSPDRPKVVDDIVDSDAIDKPWSLVRLATQKQPVRLTIHSDEVADKTYTIDVTTTLVGFDNLSIPAEVPAVPTAAVAVPAAPTSGRQP